MAKRQIAVNFLAGIALVAGCLAAIPAGAQFGQIFGAPPRPPANVPSQQRPPAPLGLPEQMPPEEMDDDAAPPPQRAVPPPAAVRTPPTTQPPQPSLQPGAVRSQPLPPPPGATVAPPSANLQPGPATPPIQPGAPASGQRPPLPRGATQPANTAPQDEVITEFPSQKIANPTAVFAGLDKITGRIISFEVALNEKVQFGALQVTPRVCYTRPPTESTNTDSFVEVDEVTLQGEVKRLFTGWMFATSPGLHAVEHPIYDIWLTDCKGGTTVISDAQPTAPPSTPSATGQRPPAPRTGNATTPTAPAGSTAGAAAARQPAQVPPVQQQLPPVPPPGFAVPRR